MSKLVYLASMLLTVPGNIAQSHPPKNASSVTRAYADTKGNVHIFEEGGKETTVPKEKDQVGSADLKIAEDQKTVGWLIENDNCDTTYPIPLNLVIWRDGKVRQHFGDGLMFYDWRFWEGGKFTAFCTGTVHGDSGGHCELHDTVSGTKVGEINGHLDDNSPAWAKGLRN